METLRGQRKIITYMTSFDLLYDNNNFNSCIIKSLTKMCP